MKRVVQIKDIGRILTGNTPSTSDAGNYNSNDILFVKPSDISDSGITKLTTAENYISNHARKKARIAPKGSVITTCIGIIGKTAILEKECAFNQQINAIIPDETLVLSPYLAYAIYAQKKYMQGKANAAVVPIINKTDFGEIQIVLHDLSTQKGIITKLKRLDYFIRHSNTILAKLDTLVKSRFIEMFGDPVTNPHKVSSCKLGDVCTLKAGITTAPQDIRANIDAEYKIPCYGGNGIRGYVHKATYSGDYPLIGRQGALCGNVQFASGFFHATEHAVLVTPKVPMNPIWLYVTLREMNLNRFQTGAAQPGLAVKTLNNVNIITPPIELQNQFAAFVQQVGKSKSVLQKLLEKQELLQAALMQEYFE